MMTTTSTGTEARPLVVEEKTTTSGKPRLLITNDDGLESPGIRILAEALHAQFPDLVVAAPAMDMSGSGTGIGRFNAEEGIDLKKAGWNDVEAYTVAGPPGLAVMAAALGAFGPKPDLVVSGINAGVNTGHSVIHSGTVGAVLTARTFGSHGLAISLAPSQPWWWQTAAEVAVSVTHWLVQQHFPKMVLNVNVPAVPVGELHGARWADLDNFGVFRVATANYDDGRLQFEIGGSLAGLDPTTDTALCREGYVTITPLAAVEPAPFPQVPADWLLPPGPDRAHRPQS